MNGSIACRNSGAPVVIGRYSLSNLTLQLQLRRVTVPPRKLAEGSDGYSAVSETGTSGPLNNYAVFLYILSPDVPGCMSKIASVINLWKVSSIQMLLIYVA